MEDCNKKNTKDMNKQERNIFGEIRQILATILNLEEQAITPESYLLRELGAESVDLLELAAALQDRFEVEINSAFLFLPRIHGGQPSWKDVPFVNEKRLEEIAADSSDTSVFKVKDLVSYVDWKINGKINTIK